MLTLIFFAVVVQLREVIAGDVTDTDNSRTYFVLEPKSGYVRRGDSVTLTCDVTEDFEVTRWLRDGQPVTSSRYVTVSGGTLRIASFGARSATTDHEGLYQCVANGTLGVIVSRPARLQRTVLEGYDYRLPDREVNVTARNVAVLPCAAASRSSPPAVSQFEFNGARLRMTARHRVLPSGNLQIEAVTSSDQGVYRCVAVNPVSLDRQPASNAIRLSIMSTANVPSSATIPARFSWTPLTTVEVVRSNTLTLECAAVGWPVPAVTWERHGGQLPNGRHRQVLGNLIIDDVQADDEGTYVCRADNLSGQPLVHVTSVEVLEPPSIMVPPSDQDVFEGDTVIFTCIAIGTMPMTVTWLHNAVVVMSNQFAQVTNFSLLLSSVQRHQSGYYQCIVNNSVNTALSVAQLNVVTVSAISNVAKSQDPTTPAFVRRKLVGPTAAMIVKPQGPQSVDKQLAGTEFLSSERTHYFDASEGTGGKAEEQMDGLAKSGRLVPPPRPAVTKISDTSVNLDWPAWSNSGLKVTFLKVQYRETVVVSERRKTTWHTIDEDVPSTSLSYRVNGLKPGNIYQFRLVAVYSNNDNKHGPNSGRFALTASVQESCVPAIAPVIVELHPISTTAVSVSWQYIPSERGSVIDGFHVFSRPYSSREDYRRYTAPGGAAARRMTLTGLLPDTTYSVKMRCFNTCGNSEFSNMAVKRTLSLSGSLRLIAKDYGGSPDDFKSTASDEYEDGWDLDDVEDDDDDDDAVIVDQSIDSYRQQSGSRSELLLVVVGVVVGVVIVSLVLIVVACVWRHRKQRRQPTFNANRVDEQLYPACNSRFKASAAGNGEQFQQILMTPSLPAENRSLPMSYSYTLAGSDTDKPGKYAEPSRLSFGCQAYGISTANNSSDVDSLLTSYRIVPNARASAPMGANSSTAGQQTTFDTICVQNYHLPVRYSGRNE